MVQNARLLIAAAQVLAVYFRIHMPIDQQQIGPAVIVKIHKHSAPAEILCVQPKSGGISYIIERAVSVVAVKRSGIV